MKVGGSATASITSSAHDRSSAFEIAPEKRQLRTKLRSSKSSLVILICLGAWSFAYVLGVLVASAVAGSLGMALGRVAGGLIFDAFATQIGLFVGAFGMGLGAFLLALNFRAVPAPAQPAPA